MPKKTIKFFIRYLKDAVFKFTNFYKNGIGHKEFAVEVDHTMTLEEASQRRDVTINAMSIDHNGLLHDPLNGMQDLNSNVLRATSSHFAEDPLRVLRVMQFAARFNFDVEEDTVNMCRKLKSEFKTLPIDRIREEFLKLVLKGQKPSKGLQFLVDCGWIDFFPELKAMIGVPQDAEWHPEGGVWQHTLHVADAAANIANREQLNQENRMVLILAAIAHDMGKPATTVHTKGRWRAPGHAAAGVEPAKRFMERIGVTKKVMERVHPLVQEHMAHCGNEPTPKMVRKLSNRLGQASIAALVQLIEADHSGRPPLTAERPKNAQRILDIADNLQVKHEQPPPLITGKVLIQQGVVPGPNMGLLIKKAFDLQLEGEIETVNEGLVALGIA